MRCTPRSLGFLLILLPFCLVWISPSEAQPAPRWSVGLKAGYFMPTLSGYELRYGERGALQLGLELEFRPTPRMGIGVEAGYFSDEGRATTVSGGSSGSRNEYVLYPLQAYLVYRFVFVPDQPLVPYLGGGYSHFTYRQALKGAPTVRGGQEGFHLRGGLQFLLDVLDPQAAEAAWRDWGLVNTYLTLEAQYARVNDFGSASVDLGGRTYFGGLLLEF